MLRILSRQRKKNILFSHLGFSLDPSTFPFLQVFTIFQLSFPHAPFPFWVTLSSPPPSKETLPYANINVPLRIQTLLIPIRIQLLTSIWIRRFTLIRIQLFHTEPYPFFTDPDPFLASVTFIFWHTSMCVFAQFRPPRSLPEKLLANSHSVDRWKSLVHI
jgi:hypothetical protein